MTDGLITPNKPNKPIKQMIEFRKELLESYKLKQSFRVSIGKSEWIEYNTFDERYNLREILNDEIVIEFDSTDLERVQRAVSGTCFSLLKAGYNVEYWDHGGKSPHLHIKNLKIGEMTSSQRATFKKFFIRRYVPIEYLDIVDTSLCGIHLIAIEWQEHWKGCYGIKELVHTYTPEEYKKVTE